MATRRVDALSQDLRSAIRRIRRAPGLAGAVALAQMRVLRNE